MKRDKSKRHEKLKDVPHPGEHTKEDGTFDLAAAEKDLPELLKAIKTGKIKVVSSAMTDPDASGNYTVTFQMQAK